MRFYDRDIKLIIFNSDGTLLQLPDSEDEDKEIRFPVKSLFETLSTKEVKTALIVSDVENYNWINDQSPIEYLDYLLFLEDDDYPKTYSFLMNKFGVSKDEILIVCQKLSHYKLAKELGFLAIGMYCYSFRNEESLDDDNCEDYIGDLYDIRFKIEEQNVLPIEEIDNYKVRKFLDGFEIMGIVNYTENLLIPAYIDKKPVYSVGKEAFDQMTFETITFEEGVREIGVFSFHKVKGVKELVIPKSVEGMSLYSFSSSEWEKVTFLGNVSSAFSSFEGCDQLKEIVFPSCFKYIDFRCFWCSDGLEELFFPEGMEWIGMQAFNNCPNLKTIHLPKSIKMISDNAFYRCPNLKTVYYNGNKEDRDKISINNEEEGNQKLIDANWIYNE